ncbi:MAG: AI-2E family transporter [Planctomycetes bacterium]|nr:AI-2E family transporter [Planctomycetota bacterium]
MNSNEQPPIDGAAGLSLLRRLAIWAIFAGVLYLLRGFFLLILMTFVIGYTAEHFVAFLQGRVRKVARPLLVILVFSASIAAIVGLGYVMIPAIESEVSHVKAKFPEYRDQIASKYKELEQSWPGISDPVARAIGRADILRRQFFGESAESLPAAGASGPADSGMDFAAATDLLLSSVRAAISAIFTFLLAWLFAFLIVLDLGTIRAEIERLQSSRVGWLYREVRASVVEFAASVGWFLEAQIAISAVNTIVTIAGLWILGLPSLPLLGVILFFCGLVPVLGALVPLVPICFIAFAEGGAPLFIKCLVFVGIERALVGYAVEPRIFGRRFHMNSVFVLVILLVGYKLAAIWGIVLGLPVAYTALRASDNGAPAPGRRNA